MENVQKRRRTIEERNRIKRKRRRAQLIRRRMRSLLLFIILFIPLIVTSSLKATEKPESITIEIQDTYMVEDEAIPEFNVKVSYTGDKDRIIDETSQATLESLIVELENGNGYSIHTKEEVDGTLEGDYELYLELDKTSKENLLHKWLGQVTIQSSSGALHVKNKYGEWQGDKFIDDRGNQVVNQFIEVKNQTFYLDEQGNKVTGIKRKGLKKYVFDDEGVLMDEEVSIDESQPVIAITLDDGPGEYTDRLLDVLEEYNSHATFFLVGSNVSAKYEDVLKRMLEVGCEIGNHTTNHPNLNNLSASEIWKEMNTTTQAIVELTGEEPTVMRPPYGAANSFAAANVGLPMIFWNVDTMDWKVRNTDTVATYIIENAKDGDIILLHDIHETSVEALEIAIPILVEQGYQLVTVSELAEIRGIDLEDGGRYYSFLDAGNEEV